MIKLTQFQLPLDRSHAKSNHFRLLRSDFLSWFDIAWAQVVDENDTEISCHLPPERFVESHYPEV